MEHDIYRATITLADRDEPITVQIETDADHERWTVFWDELCAARETASRALLLAPHRPGEGIGVAFDPHLVTRISVDPAPGATGFRLLR